MITLKREETVKFSFAEALVAVKFKIPTGAEAEIVLAEQPVDSEVFKQFVLEVQSPDISGWEKGVTAEEVVNTPQTLNLIRVVAKEIVGTVGVDVERKN